MSVDSAISYIKRHSRFILTAHETPDADAIGAECALCYALRFLGKEARIINADPTPRILSFIDDAAAVEVLEDSMVMTVRSIGGCLIDLATTAHESDQLSAFYPGRRKFPFSKAEADDQSVTVTSPGSDTSPKCVVRYEFNTDLPVIDVTSTWTNTTLQDWTPDPEDDIRADSGNEDIVKSPNGTHELFF